MVKFGFNGWAADDQFFGEDRAVSTFLVLIPHVSGGCVIASFAGETTPHIQEHDSLAMQIISMIL